MNKKYKKVANLFSIFSKICLFEDSKVENSLLQIKSVNEIKTFRKVTFIILFLHLTATFFKIVLMLRSKDSFDNNPHFFVKKGFTGLKNLFDKQDTEKGKII